MVLYQRKAEKGKEKTTKSAVIQAQDASEKSSENAPKWKTNSDKSFRNLVG